MGEELEIEVHDLARGGSGVSRGCRGLVVFVPHTLPGDRARVRITQRKKRYAHGELVELLEASPDRVEPPCPVFGTCGGCDWQHVPYALQWETKIRGLREALRRITLEIEVELDLFPASEPLGYRNRIQLRGRGREVGFHAAGSQRLVPVETCAIARPELNEVLPSIRRKGERVAGAYKVEVEVLETGKVRILWNVPHAAGGFRQVHDAQNQALKHWVDERLGRGAVLYDLYGGSGNLSELPAGRFGEVRCVDTGAPLRPPPGRDQGVRFHRAEVGPWLRGQEPLGEPASAILDPPRVGMGGAGEAIVAGMGELGVREAVLVGCDPDAFARDLGAFLRKGWEITRMAAFDFFPQTHHLEAAARLVREPGTRSGALPRVPGSGREGPHEG